ncbi:MAG TPA: ATP-binding cassette domain-containing protein, partial [Myxococcota bacterium]
MSASVLAHIRQRLFDHLQTLSPSFFQRMSGGEISARYSTDLAAVEHTVGTWIPWGVKPLLDVVGYTAVMFTVDWRLALLAQLLWPAVLIGPRVFAPRAGAAAAERKGHEASVLAAVDEATAGRHVVRAFGLEATMSRRFAGKLQALSTAVVRGALFTSGLERTASIGIYALQITVIGVGGSMAFKGTITIGQLVAFHTVFVALSNALYYLAQYSSSLITSAAGFARIEEVLQEAPAVAEAKDARALPPIERGIRLQGVAMAPVLNGVTLTIKHGDHVALVGPSGSGKSTVLNAIMRAFDPSAGSIDVDGHDLRSVTKSSFVDQTAVVFQDSFLYDTSIRENLRLARANASDADIEAACRDAELHDVIAALPQGYDAPVGERGSRLSGGQRQRLAIARALLRHPRILLLDEATSALDPGTEHAVNRTLERLAQGRTVVTVTHRLASVRNCDRVFVLNRGAVAEQGTHEELLAHNGLYASLWRKQEGIRTSDDGARADITVERLRQVPLLSHLSDAVLQDLAARQLVTETALAGRDVVVEGDPGDKLYIIARGRVEVLQRDRHGKQHVLDVLCAGDNFGELALLGNTARTATARTLVPSTFLTLDRRRFQRLLDDSPQLRATV